MSLLYYPHGSYYVSQRVVLCWFCDFSTVTVMNSGGKKNRLNRFQWLTRLPCLPGLPEVFPGTEQQDFPDAERGGRKPRPHRNPGDSEGHGPGSARRQALPAPPSGDLRLRHPAGVRAAVLQLRVATAGFRRWADLPRANWECCTSWSLQDSLSVQKRLWSICSFCFLSPPASYVCCSFAPS